MGEDLEAAQPSFEGLIKPGVFDSGGRLVCKQAKQFAVRLREGPCGFFFVNPDDADEPLPVYQGCGDDGIGFEVFHEGGVGVWRRLIVIDH
jgi:hypothetical protein